MLASDTDRADPQSEREIALLQEQLIDARRNLETAALIGRDLVQRNNELSSTLDSILRGATHSVSCDMGEDHSLHCDRMMHPVSAKMTHPDSYARTSSCYSSSSSSPAGMQPGNACYDPHHSHLQNELERYKTRAQSTNIDNIRLKASVSDLKASVDSLLTRIDDLEADKVNLKSINKNLRAELSQTKKRILNPSPGGPSSPCPSASSSKNLARFSHSPAPGAAAHSHFSNSSYSFRDYNSSTPCKPSFSSETNTLISANSSSLIPPSRRMSHSEFSTSHSRSPGLDISFSPQSYPADLKQQLYYAQLDQQVKESASAVANLTKMLSESEATLSTTLLDNERLRDEVKQIQLELEGLRAIVEEMRESEQLHSVILKSMGEEDLEESRIHFGSSFLSSLDNDGGEFLDADSGDRVAGGKFLNTREFDGRASLTLEQELRLCQSQTIRLSEPQPSESGGSIFLDTSAGIISNSLATQPRHPTNFLDDDGASTSKSILEEASFYNTAPQSFVNTALNSSDATPTAMSPERSPDRSPQHMPTEFLDEMHALVQSIASTRKSDRRKRSCSDSFLTASALRPPFLGLGIAFKAESVAVRALRSSDIASLGLFSRNRLEYVGARLDKTHCVAWAPSSEQIAGQDVGFTFPVGRDGRGGVLFAVFALAVDYCIRKF
ncbi:hypothetical protein BJ741DRAFT_612867 [Chytriomyces cf. hyalinus JEL632]|nr:hypothetical protein BJ741DRAFT_612867 [Chytriomyces cf. hyalinus JEL632]